jgi:hypothetical protein
MQARKSGMDIFDQMLQSTLIIVAIILFIICLSLIILGLKSIAEGWIDIGGDGAFISLITGLGIVVIGIAVLDLTKSMIDEEISDKKVKNTQQRARDFLTRFLAVMIFAISAEAFIKLARADASVEVGFFGDIAMLGVGVGAMLAGLAFYLRSTAHECKAVHSAQQHEEKSNLF